METKPNNKIEDILNSLDGAKRATAPAYFYTRLKARMERGLEPEIKRPWVMRPVFAFAGLMLIIILNVAVILKGDSSMDNTTATTDTESYQSIAAEYRLDDNLTEEVYK